MAKERIFEDPEWSNEIDSRGPEAPRGSYNTPGEGADNLVSSLVSQLSPLLGTLVNSMGLDKKIVEGIVGAGTILSTHGSFSQSTNHGDVFLNKMDRASYQAAMDFQGISEKMTEETARRVATLLAPQGASTQSIDARTKELTGGIFSTGIDMLADMQLERDKFERNLSGTSILAGVLTEENRSGTIHKNFREFTSTLGGTLAHDPFAFGGLKGGDVGQLATAMTSRGMLDFHGEGQNTVAMVKKVRGMANALAPLKELFGESIPELMDRLDQTFGVNAATYSPEVIQQKVLAMKHTARLTGTSVENIMKISQGASQYLYQAGETSGMGADTIATMVAGMTGSGVNMARIDADRWRQNVLRDAAGQMSSRAAKTLSGAAAILKGRGGADMSDQEAADKVRAMVEQIRANGGEGNIEELAAKLGVSVETIHAASMSNRAEDIRKNTDISTMLTSSRVDQMHALGANMLRNRARFAQGNEKAALTKLAQGFQSGAIADEKQAREALQGMGLSSDEIERVVGTFTGVSNVSAGAMGYDNIESANAAMEAEKRRRSIAQAAARRADIETAMTSSGRSNRYGVMGALMAAEEGGTIGDMVKGAFGFVPSAGNLKEDTLKTLEKNKTLGRVNSMAEMLQTGYGPNGKKLTDHDKRMIKNAIESGDVDALEYTSTQMSLNYTEEGTKATKAAEILGVEAGDYYKKTAAGKSEMLERAAVTSAMKKSGLSQDVIDEYKKASQQEDFDLAAFEKEHGITGTQKKKLQENIESEGKELGLSLKKDVPELLEMILEAVKDFNK